MSILVVAVAKNLPIFWLNSRRLEGPCLQNYQNPIQTRVWGPRLVATYRAILRYYRCDTPYRAILFKGGEHSPKMVRYPPLVLNFTQTHPCDTPFCNVSRDNCAIPHKNKHENSFAILSLQVSRDMKSIAAGPLRRDKMHGNFGGFPRRANGNNQMQQTRPELQDGLGFESCRAIKYRTGPFWKRFW